MNILITGCEGQLGNEIRLLQSQHEKHVFFNTDVAELDITDQQAVERYVDEHEIDGVVNCAAYTAVDRAESDKERATAINTLAPTFLAAAIERRGGWLIHVSTDYVFDGTKHLPYVETDTPCPEGVYGSTKLAGEFGATKFCKRTVIVRTAWLYSPFGNNFVKTMMRLGREREQLNVVFDQIGTPTYAADLAGAIMSIVEHGVVPGVYHYTNEGVCSWYDFTKSIHRIAGITGCTVLPIHTSEYPTPATRPAMSVLDKTKIKTTFALTIPHWEESLVKCIERINNQ
ncbi:MAG: dTDP-4-dehydrorhamnose reductase [Prevotella sp.]|nr:dTDP-4-dehydrorhamnose reductase [Prevotella sp.]